MSTSTQTFRGKVQEIADGMITLVVPDSSYRLHLVADEGLDAEPGQRVTGVIRARAKRVDKVGTGGRYVEPVFGRPRRVQGRVESSDPSANTITVKCGVVLVAALMHPQRAADFPEGSFVSFDVERGASFSAV